MLRINDSRVNYGGIEIIEGISFEMPKKSIITFIGINGADKNTTLRTITGLMKASVGSIQFDRIELLGMDIPDIISRDITLIPKGRRVFPNMIIVENIKIGAYLRTDPLDHSTKRIYSLFPRLKKRCWRLADTLLGGEQQILAMARTLMSRPKLMMMDEPSLSLAPLVVQDISNITKEANKQGVIILLIEQNANMALRIADQGYVLEIGRISLSDTGRELLADESMGVAHLGEKERWLHCKLVHP